jgi:hypothetical protein
MPGPHCVSLPGMTHRRGIGRPFTIQVPSCVVRIVGLLQVATGCADSDCIPMSCTTRLVSVSSGTATLPRPAELQLAC